MIPVLYGIIGRWAAWMSEWMPQIEERTEDVGLNFECNLITIVIVPLSCLYTFQYLIPTSICIFSFFYLYESDCYVTVDMPPKIVEHNRAVNGHVHHRVFYTFCCLGHPVFLLKWSVSLWLYVLRLSFVSPGSWVSYISQHVHGHCSPTHAYSFTILSRMSRRAATWSLYLFFSVSKFTCHKIPQNIDWWFASRRASLPLQRREKEWSHQHSFNHQGPV